VRNKPDPLLSTTEVAAMCGVASMTVVRWIDAGTLPAVRTPGGWRRVRRADAERHAALMAGRVGAPELTPEGLAELLTRGERDALVEWTRAHAGSGKSVADVVRSHVVPAMRRIGDAWECGDTSVGEEHRATALAYDLLALLRHVLPAPDPAPNAPRLLMACAPGEEHALPARLMSERFIDAGWRVDFLGANVPASETVRQLRATRPSALGLSVTTEAAGARDVLRQVARSEWSGLVLAGGALAPRVAPRRDDIVRYDGSADFIERVTTRVASTKPRRR
jgi:MerR family transcriptional regulator, light-induced transcriptional regulator